MSALHRFQLGSSCIRNILVGTAGQFSTEDELANVNVHCMHYELVEGKTY